jgi:asparagine synthase (glutamine-hydrolysing)
MEDNVRYGISLSGGLDSRSVLAGIPPESRKEVIAFTFGSLDCDEVKIAKIVAKKAQTKEHIILGISPELIRNNSEKEIWFTDGRNLIGNSSLTQIFRSIKDNIDVYFDGFLLDTGLASSILTKNILNAKSEKDLFELLYTKISKVSEEELSKLFVDEYYNRIKTYPLSSFIRTFDNIKEHNMGNKSNLFRIQNHTAWTRIGFALTLPFVEHSIPASDNNFIDVIRTIPPELRSNHYIYRKFLIKLSPELAEIPYNKTMVRADAPLWLWRISLKYFDTRESFNKKLYNISKGKIS